MKVVDRRVVAKKKNLERAAAGVAYVYMMGIVYRNLKLENVLIRADGHTMLIDFDLSLESTSSPSLETADGGEDDGGGASTSVSCFPDHLFRRRRRHQQRRAAAARAFVAEPVAARSCSFVGTHEYVAPEVARGGGHGAAVDWWAYGVFLYELIYGRTPFVGETNEATLRNIVRRPLEFPAAPAASHGDAAAARDLIARLLDKDPRTRLGSKRGAADVKAHGFFKGLNLALLRSSPPPVVPPAAAPLHRCDDKAADVQQLFDHF